MHIGWNRIWKVLLGCACVIGSIVLLACGQVGWGIAALEAAVLLLALQYAPPRGAAAAYALNRELACFNPTRLATSPWVRCQETLEMFAWQTGRDMVHLDPLTEDAYAAAPDTAWECLLSEIEFALERRQPIAICMHRPVIGGMFGHLRSMCVAPSLSKRLIAKTPFMPTGTAVALFVTPTPHGPKIIDIQKVQPLVY